MEGIRPDEERVSKARAANYRSEFESLAFRVAKQKRNKAKFWCHHCGSIGYRNPADAEAKAAELKMKAVECPAGYGWHIN